VEAGGKDLLMLTTNNGYSCLHAAAHKGRDGMAKMLVKAGGKDLLLLVGNDGDSCLDIAAQHGHGAMGTMLEEACKQVGMSHQQIEQLKQV